MISRLYFRRLFVPYFLLICVALAAVGLFAARLMFNSAQEQAMQAMRALSLGVGALVDGDVTPSRMMKLTPDLKSLEHETGYRITIIAADGAVLADSEAEAGKMENYLPYDEVREALANGEGSNVRTSTTAHQEVLYFARRFNGGANKNYLVHLVRGSQTVDGYLQKLYAALAMAVLCAALGAALICYFVARRNTTPMLQLNRFAQELASGKLSSRLLWPAKGELGVLAASLNSMADSLSALVEQHAKDNYELLAILGSMGEGVIATDTRQRILLVNEAVERLLEFEGDKARGKLLWEVVRIEPIVRGAREVLEGSPRRSFQVGPVAGRHLEVTICTYGQDGRSTGLVIVMHDATQSVRYQELRKEFVANVSHELRTPLTSIKGFAETLRDGAMGDPVKGPEFLATIERHADQLTNLISDLLELSRLESVPEVPQSAPVDLGSAARRAAELLMPAAVKKQQELKVKVEGRLPLVTGNSGYLERAIANLVENAVKYTPEHGRIEVTVGPQGPHVVVEVTDNGIGIPQEDIPRIFERFYRVDRSRSRDMGGTGLGLSIVKHVAQTHRGLVDVISTPGVGTSFRLKIPIAEEG